MGQGLEVSSPFIPPKEYDFVFVYGIIRTTIASIWNNISGRIEINHVTNKGKSRRTITGS